MRVKVREYISEWDAEYERGMDRAERIVSAIEMRAKTLMEVKNELQGRLEELV